MSLELRSQFERCPALSKSEIMMLPQEIIEMREKRKSTESFWNSQVLRIELGQLRREVQHLTLKEKERKLSEFEQKRITQISKEMTKLMDKARKLASRATFPKVSNNS